MSEELYFKDYFKFGVYRHFSSVKSWRAFYESATTDRDRKLAFIEVSAFYVKTLEDFTAHALGLHRTKENKTPLIETLITYWGSESYLENLIKDKSQQELLRMFGINHILKKYLPSLKTPSRRKFVDEFVQNVKLASVVQSDRSHFYNKSKHGSVVVSSIGAIRLNSTTTSDNVAVLSKSVSNPNVLPFSRIEFEATCENICRVAELISTLVYLYCLKYSPEVVRGMPIVERFKY